MNKKLKNKLGTLFAWIILSASAFVFLFSIIVIGVRYNFDHNLGISDYVKTRKFSNEIMFQINDYFDNYYYFQGKNQQLYNRENTNLAMRILKNKKVVMENYPFSPKQDSISGSYYFGNQLEHKGRDSNYFVLTTSDAEYELQYQVVYPFIAKDKFYKSEKIFKFTNENYTYFIYSLFTTLALIIMSIGYLVWQTIKKNNDENNLSFINRIPLELFLFLLIPILIVWLKISYRSIYYFLSQNAISHLYDFIFEQKEILSYIFLAIDLEIGGLVIALTILSLIARISSKTLLKNSFLYRILSYFKNIMLQNSLVMMISFIILFIIYWMLIYSLRHSILIIGLIFLPAIGLLIFMKQFNLLANIIDEYAKGNFDYTISDKYINTVFAKQFDNLYQVRNSVQRAIKEKIKSEHLKTELITNVSHDLKTPLTSILNYAQIMKNQNDTLKNKQYIDKIIHHVNRLQKLTEDVLISSKASSGNIRVQKKEINCAEILAQAISEFDQKFKAQKLKIIVNGVNERLLILADGDLLWRILNNLFTNITKYALAKTRVYINVKEDDDKVYIIIENVSKAALNISEEELMERFVQGDASRNQEGSGLGLSIVKSLVELQDGHFNLNITGDYFQVEITFKKVIKK